MSSIGESRGKSRVEFRRANGLEPPPATWRLPRWLPVVVLLPLAGPPLGRLVGTLHRGHPGWPWSAIAGAGLAAVLTLLAGVTIFLWCGARAQSRRTLAGDDGDRR